MSLADYTKNMCCWSLSIFYKGSRLVLWCAEMRLWPAVVILWRGVKVTVMMLVVVLWGGVVVVMMTVDVCIGEEEGGRGR